MDHKATPTTSFPAPPQTTTPKSAIPTSTQARNTRRDNAPEVARRRYRQRPDPGRAVQRETAYTESLRCDFAAAETCGRLNTCCSPIASRQVPQRGEQIDSPFTKKEEPVLARFSLTSTPLRTNLAAPVTPISSCCFSRTEVQPDDDVRLCERSADCAVRITGGVQLDLKPAGECVEPTPPAGARDARLVAPGRPQSVRGAL